MLIERDTIQQAKEKLGDEGALIGFAELGVTDYDERNLKCCCPFHNEDHASFIWSRKTHRFVCYGACGRSYDLIDIYMSKGATYVEACKKLFEKAKISYSFGEHNVRTKRSYTYPHEEPVNQKPHVYEYLQKRHISPKTVDYLDIREDAHGNCVFNYYDDNDVLTMVKYRPSHKIEKGQNKNWCQKNAGTTALLFNMNRINPEQPLLICCGELDCAAAVEAGYTNSVSIPLGDQNIDWLHVCEQWLEQFQEIIICPDNDESGKKFKNTVMGALGRYRTRVINLPNTIEKDGNTYRIKDINEYLFYTSKTAVLDLIVNAESTPIDTVVDLSDVDAADYEDIDGIKFGLQHLDDVLERLFMGTLTILSGRPGTGKSSLLSQLLCRAVDDGHNAFLYSAEFANGITKGWIDYVMAGPRNLVMCKSLKGNVYQRVNPEVRNLIKKQYRGKWFLYKDSCDNNVDLLFDTMAATVRRYAVRLLILDNLSCFDFENADVNEYREQTNITKRLIKFAKMYDCAIVLVCHPRKGDNKSNVGINDIAGSMNIVNLAHRTLALQRVTQAQRDSLNDPDLPAAKRELYKYDVVATVIKDRMYGRSDISVGLWFDINCRRFYTNNYEYDYRYSWDKNIYADLLLPPAQYPMETDDQSEGDQADGGAPTTPF